jgi:hypothetical protein
MVDRGITRKRLDSNDRINFKISQINEASEFDVDVENLNEKNE